MRKHLLAAAACSAISLVGATASAEVISPGTGLTTTTMPVSNTGVTITGWADVGSFLDSGYSASGVYIGNGWVLTAAHAGPGNIYFSSDGNPADGSVYYYGGSGATILTNPDGSTSDLELYQVGSTTGTYPSQNITFSSAAPTSGQQIISVGYGEIRSGSLTTIDGVPGYNEAARSPLLETWGNNTLTTAPESGGTTVYEYTSSFLGGPYTVVGIQSEFLVAGGTSEDSLIAPGDSGGAVFNSAGQLIGINDVVLGDDPDQPANTAENGNYSVYSYISPYIQNEIYDVTGVPEPGCGMMLLGGIAVAALRRRRRAAGA